MARQPGPVSPLKDLGAGRGRGKQGVGWSSARIGSRAKGLAHSHLQTQNDDRIGSGSWSGWSAVNWRDNASSLPFFKPSLYVRASLKRPTKSAHCARQEFSNFAPCRKARFLWSVQMTKGYAAPSNQYCHSWRANTRAPTS